MSTRKPNILVCGTPGTGKSELCRNLSEHSGLTYVDVGKLVLEKQLYEERDEENDCWVIDEEKVLDSLEDLCEQKNVILEYHSSGFFPERWFDLVVVLRTDNTVLYGRLEKRGYAPTKITKNVECEIMRVVLDEALESYQAEIVWEMKNDTIQDMEINLSKILEWIKSFVSR
eukprot:TRINITY_DN1893_c0_g1_i1.p1 TRINITY_DN1893_c0_g1~~TRINITY_DN1893_c0_g1_i1.p1  ORF type:complete len:172 (-),score=40.42 TRINITY_DN1893_c0_g1_i1:20-535(-)